MKNITKFISKSIIKPELAHVYVHDIDGKRYAVATDSFKLAQIPIPDDLTGIIEAGYYSAKAWKEITRQANKINPGYSAIKELVAQEMAVRDQRDLGSYPDYMQIMPKAEDLYPADLRETYTLDHLTAFLELMADIKFKTLDLGAIKYDKSKPNSTICYESPAGDLKMLLMKRNK